MRFIAIVSVAPTRASRAVTPFAAVGKHVRKAKNKVMHVFMPFRGLEGVYTRLVKRVSDVFIRNSFEPGETYAGCHLWRHSGSLGGLAGLLAENTC